MSRVVSSYRAVAAAVAVTALAFGGLAAMTAAQAATHRTAIPGTHPAWATLSGRVSTHRLSGGTVNARIYLSSRDRAGLAAYAAAVSNPHSPLYRHFLTAPQALARFGPSAAGITAVKSWVTSNGLQVTGVSDGIGGYVAVRGSLAAASKAFGVTFGEFRAPNGHSYRAPAQQATAPASVAADVLAISGLDTAPHLARPGLPPPGPNYWVAPPCSKYYAQKIAASEPKAYGRHQPWNNCGYTQRQIRDAYGVAASGMTGVGQTVAVVDAYRSPTMLSDANRFATVTGDQPFRPGQYRQHLFRPFRFAAANECDAPGWYGEESLDVEAVHGQAPDAKVRYFGASSCQDIDLLTALAYIVNTRAASIVSDSWGEPADQATLTGPYDQVFEEGAVEGIGFFFSSGDSGYESPQEDPFSDQLQVDYPTSSPWVTSVGGTSLAIGRRGQYEFETSWGTLLDPLAAGGKHWQFTPPGPYPNGYDGSSGGGVSTQYLQPFYQARVVPTALAESLPNGAHSPVPMRVVPDVSALADPSTGMLVGQTTLQPNGKTYAFSLSRIGGTSVACPVFAGIEADAQQAAGAPLGFANPAIYARYGTTAFRDVTDHPFGPGHLAQVRNNYTNPFAKKGPLVTFLRTLGIDGEGAAALPAVKGYDDATGIGSPWHYIRSFEP
jgi:subtilase family serine protease